MRARHALSLEQVPHRDAPGIPEVTILRLGGSVDSTACPLLSHALAPHLDGRTHLLLDLSEVTVLTAAGATVLVECAQQLAVHERVLVLAGADECVEASLRVARGTERLDRYRTVDEAVAAFPVTPPAGRYEATRATLGVTHEMAELRRSRRDLRAQVRTRPLIGQAMGILTERYRLPDGEAAFELLRTCSQEHNLKLRVVATAVVAAPRPQSPEGMWFPGRARRPMPAVRLLRCPGVEPTNRSSVLEAVLNEAVRCSGARRAGVQIVDPALDVLVLEKHRGFTEDFADFFAHVAGGDTACAACCRRAERVTVLDVAGDVHFDGGRSRRALLGEGIHAVDCTPVVDAVGRGVGVISTHFAEAGHRLTADEVRALDLLASETADWLAWYQRTVVLEALEQLHAMASDRSSPSRRAARTEQPRGPFPPTGPGAAVAGEGRRERAHIG